jgi:hypothetical protein
MSWARLSAQMVRESEILKGLYDIIDKKRYMRQNVSLIFLRARLATDAARRDVDHNDDACPLRMHRSTLLLSAPISDDNLKSDGPCLSIDVPFAVCEWAQAVFLRFQSKCELFLL